MNRFCIRSIAWGGLAMSSIAGCAIRPAPVTLHPASAMVRIGGAGGVAVPPRASSYKIEMVRNEREGFQFAVLSDKEALAPVRVAIVAESPDAPTATLYQVLPVNHVAPPTTGQFVVPPRRLGLIPDVLMPLKSEQDIKPEAASSAQIPLTCYVEFNSTRATRPGTYSYTLKVAGSRIAAQVSDYDIWTRLRVSVKVHDPVLPDRLPFRTATMWNWSLQDYYGRPLTVEEKQVFWDFFLDQRLSPTDFFDKTPDPSPEEAAAAHLKQRGLSVMNLTFLGGKHPRPLGPQAKDKLGPQLKQWRQQMQKAGLLDMAVILLADEPDPGTADVCRQNATWIKEQFPEVKIWVATRPAPEWDFADIFDPVTAYSTDFYKPHNYTEESFQWWRTTHPGKEHWWFHSVEPYAPYTNIRLDNLPIEARVTGWQSALYGVDGYEYFWMTDWAANKDSKDMPWPQRAAVWKTGMSGAGTLCYPDEHGLPMPSLRLVNLRDGFEDWALIEMLTGRVDATGSAATARKALVSPVCTSLSDYTTDPQVVLCIRSKIIAALAKRSAASQPSRGRP